MLRSLFPFLSPVQPAQVALQRLCPFTGLLACRQRHIPICGYRSVLGNQLALFRPRQLGQAFSFRPMFLLHLLGHSAHTVASSTLGLSRNTAYVYLRKA